MDAGADSNAWARAAERSLAGLWGLPVVCTVAKAFREQGRNRVFRLSVEGGPVASVMIKGCVGDEKHPYRVGDQHAEAAFRRLGREAAGAQMLASVGLGPQVLAVDMESGVLLLEDLGEGETMAARLLADDAVAAEEALFAYARSLGDLHAATAGEAQRFDVLLTRHGVTPDRSAAAPDLTAFAVIPELCRQLGLGIPSGLDADFGRIIGALAAPGAYLAFTPSDCCPDNHFLRGERVMFFDCEWATTRHALLDASYFLAPFPTCWCCSAMPEGLPDRLLAAYRERIPGGEDFEDQLTLAMAFWLSRSLRVHPGFSWLEEDRPWGQATLRQRILALVDRLLARPNLPTLLPSLTKLLEQLGPTLRTRWPDQAPMPLYPAFR